MYCTEYMQVRRFSPTYAIYMRLDLMGALHLDQASDHSVALHSKNLSDDQHHFTNDYVRLSPAFLHPHLWSSTEDSTVTTVRNRCVFLLITLF